MSATLTRENSVNNLENFLKDVSSSGNSYYYWVGKTTAWPTDSQPPTANQSYAESVSVYHDVVFGKLLNNNMVSAVCAYVPWVANVVYSQYDNNDQNLFSENFYVTTTDMSVFKCIDNDNGSVSTAQPSLKPTVGCYQSSDGYTWKYMFTIPSSSNSTFTTPNYIPVTPNSTVVAAAVPGTIDVYRLPIQGTNYQGYNEGLIRSVISPQQIRLANTAVQVDQFYTGCTLYLKSGLGAGQISNITSYIGSSQLATVSPPFVTYVDMELTNVLGSFSNGQLVAQMYEVCSYLYSNGYFNILDQAIQTDTGLFGYVYGANSVALTITGLSNNTPMSDNLAIYMPSRVSNLTVNAFCNSGANILTTNSLSGSANLQTYLSVGQYIRIGSYPSPGGNGFYNTRRVTSVTNSSYANVDYAWGASSNALVGDLIFNVNSAVTPTSVAYDQANAVIIQTNLTALTLTYANAQPNNSQFVLGEVVKEYSNTGVDLGANGIVAFVNSSTLIISGTQGSFTVGNNVVGLGQTSNTTALITNIVTYPSITLSEIIGTFQDGYPLFSYNLGNNNPVGNASPVSFMYIPSTDVEYVVGPTVTVTGDGSNAMAYAVVNVSPGSLFNITDIVPISVGMNYTYANVTITAPFGYGSGAVVTPVISPPSGHGSDPISELGSTSAGIAVTIDTAQNELYKFPNYGQYRRVGILKNPQFNDLFMNITTTDRNNLSLAGITAPFTNGEVILQGSTNAAGIFVSGNNTIMQVKHISGAFVNTGTTLIRGLISNSTANVTLVNSLLFAVNANQTIYDANTTCNGSLIQVTNSSSIRVMGFGGKCNANDVIYDPTINSYANVVSLYTANNTVNVTGVYGLRFNQTSRITLATNSGPFMVGERIVQQLNGANGLIIDTSHELDLTYLVNNGIISTGLLLTDANSAANGIVTFANSSYMRLTGVQGSFKAGDQYSFITGNGTITAVYPVLVVGDVLSLFENNQNALVGLTSGSLGTANIAGTIVNPDLTKNTGEIIYINDISPFTLTPNTKETFQTVVTF